MHMKNLKIHLLTITLMAFAIQLNAQFNPEARGYLDDALAKLQSGDGIQMHYEVSEVTQNETEALSEGTVYMKGKLYRVESDDFMVFFDGKDQWIYRPDDQELMIQAPDTTNLDENNPVSMLTRYKTGFKFDVKEETENFVVVNMIAQDQYSPYIMVTVKLNKVKKEFVSLQMLMRDENAIRINLTYDETHKKYAASFFNFAALGLPVKETVDLRENN